MPRIRQLHWGRIGEEADRGAAGTLFALWPEPVDHDQCFQAAGFAAFGDRDERWDADFDRLVERLVVALTQLAGPPVEAAPATAVAGWWPFVRRKQLTPVEHLTLAAGDDRWPACRLEFGAPIAAVVTTSDGHPMFWIWLARSLAASWHECLRAAASDLAVVETSLRWSALR